MCWRLDGDARAILSLKSSERDSVYATGPRPAPRHLNKQAQTLGEIGLLSAITTYAPPTYVWCWTFVVEWFSRPL